jgi:hypothetical protein
VAKPETEFHRNGTKGRTARCASCRAEVRRIQGRERRNRTAEQERKRRLWQCYRITPEQFDALREAQGGVCAICGKPPAEGKPLAVDHCHSTGVVRALLCTSCNVAVGVYELHHRAAAEYLARYGAGNPLLK